MNLIPFYNCWPYLVKNFINPLGSSAQKLLGILQTQYTEQWMLLFLLTTYPTLLIMPLHVEIKGSGFPILCLHGHPGSGFSMSVFTQHLCQRFQTLAPDLRGYGKSRVADDFEMNDHLLDLEALLTQYRIEQCLVLGWSLGGILALELALKLPQQVTGLILVATAGRPRSSHPQVSQADLFYTGLASMINWVIPSWSWNMETLGKRSLYRYLIQQHTPTAYQYLAQAGVSAYLETSGPARRALSKSLQAGYNRLKDLPQIQCPCLVLAGEADRHITAESSWETAQHLPHAQFRSYPNTAHLFPWEIPNQVLADIDHWLDQHPQVVPVKT